MKRLFRHRRLLNAGWIPAAGLTVISTAARTTRIYAREGYRGYGEYEEERQELSRPP